MAEADPNPSSDEAPTAATGEPAAPARRRPRLVALLLVAAFALPVIALLTAGFAWWQTRQLETELLAYRQGLIGSFENTSGDLALLAETLDEFERALSERDAALSGVNGDIETLAAELRALGRRVDGLQGGQLDARDNWLREQVEYYLVVANSELGLRGEVGRAIQALELADDGLLELADPRLGDVRRAIASELQALRAVRAPDLEGLLSELGALQARVPDLPMRAAAPDNYETPPDGATDDEPGLGRLWDRTKGAVTSIVRIEREDGPVELVLTESERLLARRQLELELQVARAALVERREAGFRASLEAADTLLDRDFDRDAQSVVAARAVLAGMMSAELAPPLPAIGDSLILLRTSSGAR